MRDGSSIDIERRGAFRLDMEKELVDVGWTDAGGQQYQKKITCVDFSRTGVRLDSDQPIPLDTKTHILFKAANPGSKSMTGRVIRCKQQDNGWFEIALKLDD
ncbi:PilZ domain-containing protein [Thalassomonas viridans]|uniref:PilZ domain-containing protein n=1 Tax=Thalassomonas viridans TaxID=137584 RepID=A0AAF0C9K4_9GAMM|nr:PilZ domain-containing protein [Thalassomonas viridans]WDE05566.1 PilZ domain-containing protein [Thalassomonas viridans]